MSVPSALKTELRPSKTRSSFPPTRFATAITTRWSLAVQASASSRRPCLPTANGDAAMFTITSAPALTSSPADRPPHQISSPIETPTLLPARRRTRGAPAAGSK